MQVAAGGVQTFNDVSAMVYEAATDKHCFGFASGTMRQTVAALLCLGLVKVVKANEYLSR